MESKDLKAAETIVRDEISKQVRKELSNQKYLPKNRKLRIRYAKNIFKIFDLYLRYKGDVTSMIQNHADLPPAVTIRNMIKKYNWEQYLNKLYDNVQNQITEVNVTTTIQELGELKQIKEIALKEMLVWDENGKPVRLAPGLKGKEVADIYFQCLKEIALREGKPTGREEHNITWEAIINELQSGELPLAGMEIPGGETKWH